MNHHTFVILANTIAFSAGILKGIDMEQSQGKAFLSE